MEKIYTKEELYTYTNKDLIELCRQLSIKKYSGLNKESLINLILSNSQSPGKPQSPKKSQSPDPSFLASIPAELRQSLLLTLPYSQIIELCSTDKNFSSSICASDDTWKKLFERDFGPYKNILNKSAKSQYEEALLQLNGKPDMNDKLMLAAYNGWIEVVKYLVLQKANVHANNDYALRFAAHNGHLEVVKYLVSQKANIHANNDWALRNAAYNGHLEVVKYLVSQKADIHTKDDWALRLAAFNGYLEVVKYLISQKANIHANDDWALRFAAASGHLVVVEYLVSQRANIHAEDDGALRRAEYNGHIDVVKFLQSII